MSDQNDEGDLLRLLHAANTVRAAVENAFLSNPSLSQPDTRVSSRVKTLDRAFSKLSQARVSKPQATAFDLEDLLGFRFVTLFNSSMVDALGTVLDMMATSKDVFEPDFRTIRVYTARPDSDPLSIKQAVDHFLADRQETLKPEVYPLTTLYSSVHVIVKVPCKLESLKEGPQPHALPVELQFRTAMEDVWSQVSHNTSYGKPGGVQASMVAQHLNALKQMLDGCALYASLIKIDADLGSAAASETDARPKSALSPVGSALREVPPEIGAAFAAAIDKQKLATRIADNLGGEESHQAFTEAATAFAAVEAKIRAALTNPDQLQEAIYTTQMERAFCLLYSNNEQDRADALAIYAKISETSPSDSVCRLRLGQALRRQGNLEAAQVSLEQAAELLTKAKDPRVPDAGKVLRWVHMELSAVYYRIAETKPDKFEELTNLALKSAQTWLSLTPDEDRADKIGAINNILYFSVEKIRLEGCDPLPFGEMERLVSLIDNEDIATYVPAHKQDAIYDTISRIYGHLKLPNEEFAAASRTIEAISAKVQRRAGSQKAMDQWSIVEKSLTADELDTYQYAILIISRSARSRPAS